MRIVIAHAPRRLEPATQAWGQLHNAEVRELGDAEALFRLLGELWRDGEAFMIVEHDVVPACAEVGLENLPEFAKLRGRYFPEKSADFCVAAALDDCVQPWCLHGYPDAATRAARPEHLCCTRFSRELVEGLPDLVEQSMKESGHVADYPHLDKRADELGPRHYWRLPERVAQALAREEVEAHHHEPPFAHLHDPANSVRRKSKLLREHGTSLSGIRRHQLVDYLARR